MIDRLHRWIRKQLIGDVVDRLAAVDGIIARLDALSTKIDLAEYYSHGARSTYLGNSRVLVKAIVAGAQIAYIVEADDLLLSPWFIASGRFEEHLTNFFVRNLRPDSHSIDVGSNFGFFTCLMARFSSKGRVLGIEPDERIYRIARDNVEINGFAEYASVVHAAAGKSDDDVDLFRRVGRSANTSIVRAPQALTDPKGEPACERFTAKGIRLDDLLDRMAGRVDFVKIDVEGAEPLVIEGAHKTIASNPGIQIVMEWSPGQIRDAGFDVSEFADKLAALQLSAFEPEDHGLRLVSFSDLLNMPYRAGLVLKRA
jgi:FkbM family methyltransferase